MWTAYALVPTGTDGKTRHSVGLPPELTDGVDHRRDMEPARIVCLYERQSGGYLSYRYAQSGAFAGDTWNATRKDAVAQLEWEYGVNLEWHDMPPNVDDIEKFVKGVIES
jgi:hypothetical protein